MLEMFGGAVDLSVNVAANSPAVKRYLQRYLDCCYASPMSAVRIKSIWINYLCVLDCLYTFDKALADCRRRR